MLACDDLLNQPENYQKGLEVYGYLMERLEQEKEPNIKINKEILNFSKQRYFSV